MNTCKKAIVLLALTALTLTPVRADLNADMKEMFNSMGVMGNYSSPTSFQAQNRGYFVGGSVSVRTPFRPPLVPVSFQRPSFSAGCGGIDMHFGSISFLEVDAYKQFFQRLPTDAALGYGLKVGLKQISPTLSDAFKEVEDIINKINHYAMNSCQAAQIAVEGAVGMVTETNFSRCAQRKRSKEGGGLNAFDALKYCQEHPAEVESGGKGGPKSEEAVTGNVVWKALSKVDGLTHKDKELLLSIFGTVVLEAGKDTPYPPTVGTFKDFFHGQEDPNYKLPAGIKPNEVPQARGYTLYHCDTECLKPNKLFTPADTFPMLVEKRMQDIADRLLTERHQSRENIMFVNGTSYPVFRMLVLTTATGDPGLAKAFIGKYKDVIAVEMAITYVEKLVSQANSILTTSGHVMSKAETDLLANIARVGRDFKAGARDEERSLATKIEASLDLQADLETLQKSIYGNVPENVRRLVAAAR